MKVLIWVLCFFANALITTVLKEELGIGLGAIPTILLYGGTIWLARILCKKWDNHKNNKQESKNSPKENTTHICLSDKEETLHTRGYNDIPISDLRLDTSVQLPESYIQQYHLSDNTQQTKTEVNKNKESKKFCSHCGGGIDPITKKCNGCGKQYFKGIKFNKFSVAIIVISMILVTSVILNIIQYNKIDTMMLRQTYLEDETKELYKELSELRSTRWENQGLANFVDKYVVFIEDNGTKRYHKYNCEDFKGESFWVFNTEAAEGEGYYACPKCH